MVNKFIKKSIIICCFLLIVAGVLGVFFWSKASYVSIIVPPSRYVPDPSFMDRRLPLETVIPSIWPIKVGRGQIIRFFGYNINTFTGEYYFHRGIDISTTRANDPVVATANGQVIRVKFDADYGNLIEIRHMYGYYTRYAHLNNIIKQLGQRVRQGDVIGFIGSTGISIKPHLHYEILIGAEVVDPYGYLNR